MKNVSKEEFIDFFTTNNRSGYKTKENYVKKNFIELFEEVNKYNELYFKVELPFTQKLYNYLHNITEIPKCENCGNEIKWRGIFSEGYLKYCSVDCRNKSKLRIVRMKKTNMLKYGVDSVLKNNEILDKRKKTIKDKYGTDNLFKVNEIKEKIKKTNIEKYGTEYPIQNVLIKEKRKINNIKKYGVEVPSKLPQFKEKNTLFHKKYIENKFKKKGYIILDYLENNKIKVLHPDGHVFEGDRVLLNNRFNHNTELSLLLVPFGGLKSTYEAEIKKFLNSIGIKYQEGVKKVLNGLEIDIFIPEKKLGIEFNGLFWHSELFKDTTYHLNKTEISEKNNITLIQIFEDEWVYKKDIVKSIIKSKLNMYDNKIYARKCVVKEIDNKSCTEFLNKTHIQGSVPSKIKLGLFYNNELVGVMTFGKKRVSLGNKVRSENEYEMLRYSTKLYTQVIGGASKLLNYFIKKYKPKLILSFADRRYSKGDLYKILGFHFIKNTKPNYWYIKKNDLMREFRFKYRKSVLVKMGFDKNKTEHEIMRENGYLRIYDCGNMKFEMKL